MTIPSDPGLFTIETLEIELQRLTQEFDRAIENGELGIQITKTLQKPERIFKSYLIVW